MTGPSPDAGAAGRTTLAAALGVGALAGITSGLFGIGGGTVIVPGLVLLAGMGQRLAHGTSLAAIVPVAASGVVGFATEGELDWAVAGVLLGGSLVGSWLGTKWLHAVDPARLTRLFAGVLVVAAVRMLVDVPDPTGRPDLDAGLVAGLLGLGLGGGVVAGLLGVGGGIVFVPGQLLLFGIPDALAKGTSLAVIVPTSIVGTVNNVRNRNVDIRAAATIGLAGVATAFAASKVAVDLDPTVSAVTFAALLVVVALRLVRR